MHRLKDLSAPEHVFQLCHPQLEDDFPPLRSLDAQPNNLPVQLNSFVGRRAEMPEVKAMLGSTRLLTFTGTGGAGKTRLAVQVAADQLEDYPDGVWFVELARVADPALVPRVTASAMRVREQQGRSIVDTLVDNLTAAVSLVLLDNCEHLIEVCAEFAETLLTACPNLTILATSREPLGIVGETLWTIPPLTLPDSGDATTSVKELARSEAIQLFVDRATSRNPRFSFDAVTAPSVAAICLRLEGIPLAIELAAARVHTMTVADVRERLDDRFRLLTTGSRTASGRHQTLRATVDWSHDLLSEQERTLLRRLSVFAGGFTLDAAERVCADAEVHEQAVLDLLSLLVAKSLVRLPEDLGHGRYGLLETIREYGQEKLRDAGEEADLRARHLRWCIDVAERSEPELHGPDQHAWLDVLHLDLDNFRAAFGWSLDDPEPESALRLASALLEFWIVRADWSEGREWVERALTLPGEVDPGLRAKALRAAGELADVLSDYPGSTAHFEESLRIARRLGDEREIAAALLGMAHEAERVGRSKDARPQLEEAVALLRRVGDEPSIARSLGGLAWLEENYPRARALWVEHLEVRRKLANLEAVAWAVLQVGWAAEGEGDYPGARAAYEEALAIGRELGYKRMIARSLTQLAETGTHEGRTDDARLLFEETLPIWREIGHKSGLVDSLRGLGDVARLEGDHSLADSLLAESLAVCREIGAHEGEARALQSLAALSRAGQELSEAGSRYRRALALWKEMDHLDGIVACLRGLGEVAVQEGSLQRAVLLFGAAETLMERVGGHVAPCDRDDLESAMATARAGLGADRFETDRESGRSMNVDDAVGLALATASSEP